MCQRATVYVCNSHRLAQDAIKTLKNAGCDLKHLSVVGKDCCSVDQSLNYCEDTAAQKKLAAWVAFWHRIWSQLAGDAFLTIPGVGPVLVAGPLAQPMVSAWTDLRFEDEINPLGEVLRGWRMSLKSIAQYEAALADGLILLIVHGDPGEVARAREALDSPRGRKAFVPVETTEAPSEQRL